ncbi:hypothetical protein Tco_0347878 [Tanacetum coccineum]
MQLRSDAIYAKDHTTQTKDCPLKKRKTLEEAYYTQFGAPYQPGGQYIAVAIRNQGASIKTLEIQIGQMSKVLQERGIGGLLGSTEPNPRDHVKSISTFKANSSAICRIRSGPYAISDAQYSSLSSKTVPFPSRLHGYYCDDWKEARKVKILETYDHTLPQKEKDIGSFTLPCFIHDICFDKALVDLGASVSVMPFSTYSNLGLDFVILDIPEDEDVPLILGRPFLSPTRAKIDVFKRKITLRGDHEGKNLAGSLIDIPIFFGNFSIISGFSIIDDVDITSGVVLGMPFCKRFESCQMIMERFAHRDECKRMDE